MRKKSFNLLFPLLICLLAGPGIRQAYAQSPVFSTKVSSEKVAQNTVFNVQFELENAQGDNFQPPPFENFKVVGGPSTSSSTMIMNGSVSRSESWTYSLLAIKEGTFTIGSANVAAGRKVLTTRPITIEVVKEKSAASSGITSSGHEKIILLADLDTSTYYPGQQIILRYKLLFNENIQSVSALSEDDYSDFFIQNFSNISRQSSTDYVNGTAFTSRVIKAIALFAHQSGNDTIEPMILDVGVESPFSEQRGFFSMRSMETVKVASEPKFIHIIPLPPGAPNSFSGAVGQYSITAGRGQTDLTTDDAFTLTVDIKGNGDSRRWDPPAPVVNGDFEIYDPRIISDKMTDESDHISHLRTIEYQMIPRQPGQYKVVIPMIYFNPDTRKYETAKTDTIILHVTQGRNNGKVSIIDNQPETPKQLRKIRNIYTDDRFWLSIPHLFLFGFVLTGTLWGMWFSYKRRREDLIPTAEKIRAAASHHARLQLDVLQTDSEKLSTKEFFERATEIFYKYLSDVLTIPPSELDQGKLPYYLEKRGTPETVRENVTRFFDQCLSVRYGGIPGGFTRDEMLAEIRGIIDRMEK